MAEAAAIVDFSRSLYDAAAVQAAVAAYSDLARFEVEASDTQVTVAVHDPHPEVADLADHFANHVLHESVAIARRGGEAS